jgi:hypothetical protein
MFAVMAIALGTPAALAGDNVHLPGKCMVHFGARVRQVDCTFAPQGAQPPNVHDPFESMHQE